MESESLEKFKKFAKKAKTRCGVRFECEVFQVNREGELSSVKGKIFIKDKNEEETAIEMIWNLEGVAMSMGPSYDLVREIPFK